MFKKITFWHVFAVFGWLLALVGAYLQENYVREWQAEAKWHFTKYCSIGNSKNSIRAVKLDGHMVQYVCEDLIGRPVSVMKSQPDDGSQ